MFGFENVGSIHDQPIVTVRPPIKFLIASQMFTVP
jgi:hypothetical protein